MSRRKKEIVEDEEFVKRFTEVCGTAQPAEIQRQFGFSYQAAKNYLKGNYPETNVLLAIAKKTNYSIHWLLTGEGEKLLSKDIVDYFYSLNKDNTAKLEILIRKIFLEEISTILLSKIGNDMENGEQLTAKMPKKQIFEEKPKIEDKKNLDKKIK